MDSLTAFLDGPRARDAFLLRSVMDPPWSLRIEDEAPLTIVAMVRGEAWIVPDDARPQPLHPGDVAIILGPEPYTVADEPTTPPQVTIHPGQHCTDAGAGANGASVAETMGLGVRTWGNSTSASAGSVMLTGTYTSDGEINRRLLAVLPALVVLPHASWDSPLVGLLAEEITRDEPGQEVVLDRLLDLLLIASLRAWFSRPEVAPPAWYHAHADPVVGPALRMLQNDPAHPWSVAGLAAETGVSRAALARRFHALVGEPPMAFLAGWRLALAADLLRDPRASVSGVAHQVGYTSPFTFSTAFKRHYGESPSAHRDRGGTITRDAPRPEEPRRA